MPLRLNNKPRSGDEFDFAREARRLLRDHPQLSGKRLFAGLVQCESGQQPLARFRSHLSPAFHDALRRARDAALPLRGPGVAPAGNAEDLFLDEAHRPLALFALYHEAGRLILPRSRLDPFSATLESCGADAYAVLRFGRHYGADSEGLRGLGAARAAAFISTGAPEQLTTFVVDRLLADNDFRKTAPPETVDTVKRYVACYALSRKDCERLKQAFAPLKGRPFDDATLNDLADIVLDDKACPMTFYIGQRALMHLLPEDAKWDPVRAKVARKLEKFRLEDVFPAVPGPVKASGRRISASSP